MKITTSIKTTTFNKLKPGDVFEYKEFHFIVVQEFFEDNGDTINAICLDDGDRFGFLGTSFVTYYSDAELILTK